jgi:flagellar biosynthesis protein FlhB
MAENDEKDDKTEPATPHKRQEAREEGKVPSSREVYLIVTLLGAVWLLTVFGPRMFEEMAAMTRSCLSLQTPPPGSLQGLSTFFMYITAEYFKITLPFLLSLLLLGIASKWAQTGLVFTLKPLVPNFSRFNPVSGFKNIFSMRSLVQLVLNIIKLVVIGKFVYDAMVEIMPQAMILSFMEPYEIFIYAASLIFGLALKIGIFLSALALCDFAYQRWEHEKSLRMSKQDVKDELKTQEGDPRVKARMRSVRLHLARQRMYSDVPQADVVITNPIHFAVVIKYDVMSHAAPRVTAKGARLVAERIKQIARDNGIPIVENPYLARALFKAVDVGDQIPEQFYQAIAEILSYVYQVNKDKLRTITEQLSGAAA